MIAGLISEGLKGLFGLIDQIVEDRDQAARLKAAAGEMVHEARMAQIRVNMEEARHPSVFVAGWRPALGWACVATIVYACLLQPIIIFGAMLIWRVPIHPPMIEVEMLYPIILGMLGLGGLRSYEKRSGFARNRIRRAAEPSDDSGHTGF